MDWLHFWAGLNDKQRPLQLWKETAPGILAPIRLNPGRKLVAQNIQHGDVIVYQEHPSKLPSGGRKLRNAKTFLEEASKVEAAGEATSKVPGAAEKLSASASIASSSNADELGGAQTSS